MMDERLVIRDFMPTLESDRKILSLFLARHKLRFEEDVEYAVGLCENDRLVACGCCTGPLLKCFAVEEDLRGKNVLGRIVSTLVANRYSAGYYEPIVITPPYNRLLFLNCGFFPVAETEDLVFLEQSPDGIERYYAKMQHPEDEGEDVGAIVVNCNPFTLGHRYLVEYAAANCGLLHVFVVQEDQSVFPFKVRLSLVEQGVADLPNVRVHAGGIYIISSATFPTYFLKKKDDAVKLQAKLDATIFATRIAPLFSIKVRFVGSEPKCPVTSQYNRILHKVLPPAGIKVMEIPRRTTEDGEVISASRVRNLLSKGGLDSSLLELVPETTYKYLASEDIVPIIKALQETG